MEATFLDARTSIWVSETRIVPWGGKVSRVQTSRANGYRKLSNLISFLELIEKEEEEQQQARPSRSPPLVPPSALNKQL